MFTQTPFIPYTTGQNFRSWYAQTYERPCPAGASCPLGEADARARGRGETAYQFPYKLIVDGEMVREEERGGGGLRLVGEAAGRTGYSYLPRSGRQSIITDYVLPADGAAHRVRVEVNPERRVEAGAGLPTHLVPESDYRNNDLDRVLRRELAIRLHLRFGQFVVFRDGDRRSSGELKQLKVRLCREGGGCSPRAEAYARDRALGRGGIVFSDPLSIDNGDTISGRFSISNLEVTGSTLDRYFIEVYAYENDGLCFFANCDDWGTGELHFPIPPRLRTGVPDTCGSAATFVPASEDPRAEGFFWDYRGSSAGPEIFPSAVSICVTRDYGVPGR